MGRKKVAMIKVKGSKVMGNKRERILILGRDEYRGPMITRKKNQSVFDNVGSDN